MNLQITAHLSNSIAVYDDWSPQLEGLIVYQLLKEKGIASPNPTTEQVKVNMAVIADSIPFEQWQGIYKCSGPIYKYKTEQTDKFRKRWEPDGRVNWGKRKAKIDTSQGKEKSYDLPLFLRLTPRIDWFAVGDKTEIERLLKGVTGLGKKRSHGHGQVHLWEVKKIAEDWSLSKNGQLTKPIPANKYLDLGLIHPCDVVNWGYRPPAWLPENKTLCVMPRMVVQC